MSEKIETFETPGTSVPPVPPTKLAPSAIVAEGKNNKVQCIIDSYIFAGFIYEFYPYEVESLEEIAVMTISSLHESLRLLNLNKLIYLLDSKEFEIHGVSIEDIKADKVNSIKLSEKITKL
jgi:hypothetical protein